MLRPQPKQAVGYWNLFVYGIYQRLYRSCSAVGIKVYLPIMWALLWGRYVDFSLCQMSRILRSERTEILSVIYQIISWLISIFCCMKHNVYKLPIVYIKLTKPLYFKKNHICIKECICIHFYQLIASGYFLSTPQN